MHAKTLIAVVAVLSVTTASVANAYHSKRHKTVRHHRPAVVYVQPASMADPGPRPIWAAPGSCYTDEGYGRYWPCGAGPNGR